MCLTSPSTAINLHRYIDHFVYKGHLCIITDYCEAGDLFQMLRARKVPLLEGQILELLAQVRCWQRSWSLGKGSLLEGQLLELLAQVGYRQGRGFVGTGRWFAGAAGTGHRATGTGRLLARAVVCEKGAFENGSEPVPLVWQGANGGWIRRDRHWSCWHRWVDGKGAGLQVQGGAL